MHPAKVEARDHQGMEAKGLPLMVGRAVVGVDSGWAKALGQALKDLPWAEMLAVQAELLELVAMVGLAVALLGRQQRDLVVLLVLEVLQALGQELQGPPFLVEL